MTMLIEPMAVDTDDSVQPLLFVEPLPGFVDEDQYTITPIDERGLLFSLRSVRDPGLRFVLTAAGAFFPDYRPDLVSAVAGVLGGTDIEVLVMLTIGAGLIDATANLRAPVVVCRSTGRAVQVILDDESLPMRELLVRP
jgi:flagellar assembly factor FliW